MNSFRVRLQHKPGKSSRRLWIEAIVVGLVAIGILAGTLFALGNPSAYGPLFAFVIAGVLGWRYGALRGAVATVVPLGAFVVGELIRQALGGSGGSAPVATVLIGVSAGLLLAAVAALLGSIRTRYRPLKIDDDTV